VAGETKVAAQNLKTASAASAIRPDRTRIGLRPPRQQAIDARAGVPAGFSWIGIGFGLKNRL
jgi:hypothetical protein